MATTATTRVCSKVLSAPCRDSPCPSPAFSIVLRSSSSHSRESPLFRTGTVVGSRGKYRGLPHPHASPATSHAHPVCRSANPGLLQTCTAFPAEPSAARASAMPRAFRRFPPATRERLSAPMAVLLTASPRRAAAVRSLPLASVAGRCVRGSTKARQRMRTVRADHRHVRTGRLSARTVSPRA